MAEERDLFAHNEADFVLLEGTTCMLPVGLQKGGEPVSLYFAKACCYWKSVHFRSYSTCLQTAEFFILWYDEGIIFKKTKNLFTPPLFHHCILSFFLYFAVLCLGYAWTQIKYMFRQMSWRVHTGINLHTAYFKVQTCILLTLVASLTSLCSV